MTIVISELLCTEINVCRNCIEMVNMVVFNSYNRNDFVTSRGTEV